MKCVIKAAAKKIDVVHAPRRAGEVRYSVASIKRAKKVLGFSPKIRVEQGVRDYFVWFKKC